MRLLKQMSLLLVAGFAAGALTLSVKAQVVIDMPKPPLKAPPPDATALALPSGSNATIGYAAATTADTVDVGSLALRRYVRARYGTYDNYNMDPYYAGYRYYSYPVYYGYPFFWWGFPFFHCW